MLTNLPLVIYHLKTIYKDFNGFNPIKISQLVPELFLFEYLHVKDFTNINHDNVRRHDSTVHYIIYGDVRRHDSSKLVKYHLG